MTIVNYDTPSFLVFIIELLFSATAIWPMPYAADSHYCMS